MDTIPVEVVLHIHSFFDPETFVLSAPRVCHLWKDINLVMKKKLYKSVRMAMREDRPCEPSHYVTSNGWKMFTTGNCQWLFDLKHGTEIVDERTFIWKYGKRILEKRNCIIYRNKFDERTCSGKELCPECTKKRQGKR